MGNISFKHIVPHLLAICAFILVSVCFFYPQIQGNKLLQSDIVSYQSAAHEVKQFEQETGETALWTNSLFGGMPTYQIRIGKGGNKMLLLERISQLFITRPIGYFIGAMIGFYILFLVLRVEPWLAVIGAIGFALSTNNLVLFEAGHTSKLRSLFVVAPMIAGVVLAYRNKLLLGGVLFTAAIAVNLFVNHFQITYYVLILLGIYGLFVLRDAIKEKKMKAFWQATAVLAIGALLAVGSSASKILTTMEYADDTMRGKPILENNTASAGSSSETDGLAWDYAMNWSNGVEDVLATVVPRAAGGSGSEATGTGSNVYMELSKRGVRLPDSFSEPLYHGSLPFTSGPAYFGALLVFLFFLGALIVPGRLKWWLVASVVITVLMSMGKHAAWFNQILFDYLPLFNKFRAPSSILTVTALFIPILAVLGIKEWLADNVSSDQKRKALFISGGVMAGLCLFIAFAGSSLFDMSSAGDARYASMGFDIDALEADRAKYLRADALRSLIFVILGCAGLWFSAKGKLKHTWLIAGIGLLTLIDLWGVDRRYIDADDFVTPAQYDAMFEMEEVDRVILRDESLHYRVHDVTVDPWNSASRAYYHKLIGGYHPAKLQRYQDMIDYYLSQGHQPTLNMLNARYFIVPGQDGTPQVQRNSQAFGNAWFIEDIHIVETADEEIEALANLDPRADAVIHRDFAHLVEGFDPVKFGSITLTDYQPHRLKYTADAQGDQLAVFSEVWFGPDKGWQAYLDGQPVEHFRANYVLRAMNVPNGKHEIEFVFDPATYRTGNTLSLIFSLLIILGLIGTLGYLLKKQSDLVPAVDSNTGKSSMKPKTTSKKRKPRKSS